MPKRIGLRLEEWPAEDQVAWSVAFQQAAGPLDDSGPAAHWRPKTVADAQFEYGRWLAFIKHFDATVLEKTPADRASTIAVRAYVDALAARVSRMSVAAALNHLVLALRALCPSTDWCWVRRIQQKVAATAVACDKRRRMVSAHQLYELGWQLMREADQARTKAERFRAYRDGLVIALLCSRPLRRKNFANLQLGRNLVISDSSIRLAFTIAEMKNHRARDENAPVALVPSIKNYLMMRASLARAANHDVVWCSSTGRFLQPDAIYRIVLRRTRNAFGVAVNMHLFRDIAATTFATVRPEQVRLARDLLGHSSVSTTERHYLQAESEIAGTEYIRITHEMRADSRWGDAIQTENMESPL